MPQVMHDTPIAPSGTQVNDQVRILILEHDSNDLELLKYELVKTGLSYTTFEVSTEKAFEKAVIEFSPDVILSDFSLPTFNGTKAFKIRQELAPDVPFIFVSGHIGEEHSIELIKTGLTDYVMKNKLSTLKFKLNRALEESKEKRARKLIEREHLRNESRLNEAQKIARIGSWEKDLLINKHTWSEQFYHILGLSRDIKPSTEAYLSMVHPGDIDLVRKKIQNFELFLLDIIFEHRILRKDGSVRYVYCESRNEINAEGQATRQYGIIHDITERKLFERQREFEANNHKALINNTSDVIWSVDRDFNLITSNHSFEKAVNAYTGQSVRKGTNLLKLGYYDELNKRYREYYSKAFEGKSFTVIEYMNVPSDSWLEISFYPIRSGNEIIGTACYSRDITERKLFERELEKNTREILRIKDQLEQSEKSLKESQKMARIGTWETNLYTNRTTWSDEIFEILEVSRKEVKPSMQAFLGYVHPEDRKRVEKVIQEGTRDLNGFVFNCRLIGRNGQVKFIYFNSRYIMNEEGKPERIHGILHDVTGYK
jgi:PAS domain S-box-containing protein